MAASCTHCSWRFSPMRASARRSKSWTVPSAPELRGGPFMNDAPPRPKTVADDAIVRVIRVPPESHGMRLDRFLTTQLRATSRTRAALIIENSAFSWEGRRLKSSERVKGEDRIVLWRPALDEAPPPSDLTTIYEDDYLLVVNKPPLMTVHPTARHHRHTVIR